MSLRKLILTAIALTAIIAAVANADAQESVDDGDFNEGNAGAAPNQDSDYVPGLTFGQPTYGGTGCPQGTLHAVLSPDQKTLSVLFDSYIAEAGSAAGVRREIANCQINIPFNVPDSYRVQVVKMDYRGFASVPKGARAVFSAGFRFLEINGMPAPDTDRFSRKRTLPGPRQQNFHLSSVLRGKRFSPCGQPFVIAAESSLKARSNPAGEQVVATIDSLDAVQLPVQLALRWKKCERTARPDRPDRPNRPGRPGRKVF